MQDSSRGTCLAILMAFVAAPSIAPAPAPIKPVAGAPGPILPGPALAHFFDTKIPRLREEHHIAGMTVSVFRKNRVLFSRGYGWADVAGRRAVDPMRTMFRAGSISKLYTWTAVMQLVEGGRLDLNRDINDYLDFRIPNDRFGPITMTHLMSHTPGFEDRLIGLFYKDPKKLGSLRAAVLNVPQRVRAPGNHIAYSNYGVMLAGYIVERLSGLPFESYVEHRILRPLGLRQTTFRQPLPGQFETQASKGYTYEDGRFVAQDFELVNGTPAGGVTVSAGDLTRFLQAHMDLGRLLLRPETARLMHTTHWSADPRAGGMAHGFIETRMNGRRMIGHGGDTLYFHSMCGFIPGEDLGFFISANTATAAPAVMQLVNDFLVRLYPGPTGAELSRAFRKPSDPSQFLGEYQATRRSESDLTKIMSLFMKTVVRRSDRGGLLISSALTGGKPATYVEVEPRVFQKVDGHDRIVFLAPSGTVDSLLIGALPVITFRRPPWFENSTLTLMSFLLGFLLVLSGLVFRPTGLLAFASRRFREAQSPASKRASIAGGVLALSYAAFVITVLLSMSGDVIFAGAPPTWPFFFPYAALAANLACLAFTLQAWRSSWWPLAARVHYSLLAGGGLVLFLELWLWKLTA